MKQAGFQNRLREFLDEQGHPIGLADNLDGHLRGQRFLSSHIKDDRLGLLAPEPVEPQHGHVRLIEPLRDKLRPETHQQEHGCGVD
jgi:hypothetical protein